MKSAHSSRSVLVEVQRRLGAEVKGISHKYWVLSISQPASGIMFRGKPGTQQIHVPQIYDWHNYDEAQVTQDCFPNCSQRMLQVLPLYRPGIQRQCCLPHSSRTPELRYVHCRVRASRGCKKATRLFRMYTSSVDFHAIL